MSKKITFTGILVLVFVIVLMAFAGTALASYDFTTHTVDHSMIYATSSFEKHDEAAVGGNPCEACHTPHGAYGAYLWAEPLHADGSVTAGTVGSTDGTVDAGYSSSIKPLCYSCHDGTSTDLGTATVFSAGHYNHRTTADSVGKDCDRCHNPHDNSRYASDGSIIADVTSKYLLPEYRTRTYDENGNPAKVNSTGTALLLYNTAAGANNTAYNDAGRSQYIYRWGRLVTGGNFCSSCHEANMPDKTSSSKRNVHPVYQAAGSMLPFASSTATIGDVTVSFSTAGAVTGALLKSSYVSNVTTVETKANPGLNPTVSIWPKIGNFNPSDTDGLRNGTRLFNTDGSLSSALSTGQGGSYSSTAQVMCESCHTPHGALNGEASGYHILNTMDNGTFCGNCH